MARVEPGATDRSPGEAAGQEKRVRGGLKPGRRRSAAAGRRLIARWAASGLRGTEFCRRARIAPHIFYYWKRRAGLAAGGRGAPSADWAGVRGLAESGAGRVPGLGCRGLVVGARGRGGIPGEPEGAELGGLRWVEARGVRGRPGAQDRSLAPDGRALGRTVGVAVAERPDAAWPGLGECGGQAWCGAEPRVHVRLRNGRVLSFAATLPLAQVRRLADALEQDGAPC